MCVLWVGKQLIAWQIECGKNAAGWSQFGFNVQNEVVGCAHWQVPPMREKWVLAAYANL